MAAGCAKARPPGTPVARRRLHTWRGVSGFGGLVLACTFFMPAVRVCNSPLVPAEEAWEAASARPVEWMGVFSLYWFPYIFGGLVFAVTVRGRAGPGPVFGPGPVLGPGPVSGPESEPGPASGPTSEPGPASGPGPALGPGPESAPRRLGLGIAALFAPVSVLAAASLLTSPQGVFSTADGICLGAAVIGAPVYFLRSLPFTEASLLGLRWYAAGCCAAWFMCLFIHVESYYGLWVSLAAALAIAVATQQEAAIRGGCSWLKAGWRLLWNRLRIDDLEGPRCQHCGYLLIGLSSGRCPECGRVLEADRVC